MRVTKDDKFVVLKVYDNLTREEIFNSRALLSDKDSVRQMFLDAEAKGIFLR